MAADSTTKGPDGFKPVVKESKLSSMAQVAILALIAVMLFSGALVLHKDKTKELWNPLGDYPIQEINLPEEKIPESEGAAPNAVRPTLDYKTGSETVPVSATKCNNWPGDVLVHGQTTWRLVNVPGTYVLAAAGQAYRKSGCQSFNYKNPIPPDVKTRVEQLHNEGVDVSVWQLTGSDIPIDGDGLDGVPRYWQSKNFSIRWDRD